MSAVPRDVLPRVGDPPSPRLDKKPGQVSALTYARAASSARPAATAVPTVDLADVIVAMVTLMVVATATQGTGMATATGMVMATVVPVVGEVVVHVPTLWERLLADSARMLAAIQRCPTLIQVHRRDKPLIRTTRCEVREISCKRIHLRLVLIKKPISILAKDEVAVVGSTD